MLRTLSFLLRLVDFGVFFWKTGFHEFGQRIDSDLGVWTIGF